MGFMHIDNLYKSQEILLFKECFASEKVHGTSAHISWKAGACTFFSGGEKHERFVALFDAERLKAEFTAIGQPVVTVFGEAYGGAQQGMKDVYGPVLRFIAFDVKIGDLWLAMPDAEQIVMQLGLEFIPYVRIPTDLDRINAERDTSSEVARRRGCGDQPREGVVLRPLIEVRKNNGERIIAKHKRDDFAECATPPKVIDPAKLAVLKIADAIAQEWVTYNRISNARSHFQRDEWRIENMKTLIAYIVEDVIRESSGETIIDGASRKAIASRAAQLIRDDIRKAQ